MTPLPAVITDALADPVFQRDHPNEVLSAIERLGVPIPEAFRHFYGKYGGPFCSSHTGFELVEMIEGRLPPERHSFVEFLEYYFA
jgi:hypothetical protein